MMNKMIDHQHLLKLYMAFVMDQSGSTYTSLMELDMFFSDADIDELRRLAEAAIQMKGRPFS